MRLAPVARPELAAGALKGIPADTIAALLERLAVPGVSDLILHLESRRETVDPGAVHELIRVAGVAAATGDLEVVRAAVARIAALDPEGAQKLQNEPKLEAVRAHVKAVLEQVAEEAHERAERLLEDAEAGVSAARPRLRPAEARDADTLLMLAGQLLESGRQADFVRSAELSQVLLLHFPVGAPAVIAMQRTTTGAAVADETPIGRWWRRAPVLILLGAWLVVGGLALLLASSKAAAGLWGAGFLAFIVYFRIRSLRI